MDAIVNAENSGARKITGEPSADDLANSAFDDKIIIPLVFAKVSRGQGLGKPHQTAGWRGIADRPIGIERRVVGEVVGLEFDARSAKAGPFHFTRPIVG